MDLSFADEAFAQYIDCGYANLSTEVGTSGVAGASAPAIVTKTLNTICGAKNAKAALIVIDCMSMFDFEILSRYFDGIKYECGGSFALIPTTT